MATTAEMGYGETVKWIIVKIQIYKEIQDLYKLKNSFENQHSNIPSFHYSPAMAG